MYETKNEPLAPKSVFFQRFFNNVFFACGILAVCLLIGVFGYHLTAGAGWIDSIHNASMILSGMGPVIEIRTDGGKIFSSIYALFSGIVFITNIGVILAPILHRLYHRLHLQDDDATS